MFTFTFTELRNAWVLRLKAMKKCQIQYIKQDLKNVEKNNELLDDFNKSYILKIQTLEKREYLSYEESDESSDSSSD
jgi:hypothetical protein